jgi:probable HAF family extracellular repeat protein
VCAIVLGGAADRAHAQGFDFQFDAESVRPSAQGGSYWNVDIPDETSVFTASSGYLRQNTTRYPLYSGAGYELYDRFDHSLDGTLEFRARLLECVPTDPAACVGGASVVVIDDGYGWVFSLTPGGLWATAPTSTSSTEWVPLVPNGLEAYPEYTASNEHLYRIHIPANSSIYTVYIDGIQVATGQAYAQPGSSYAFFGDGTPTGGNAAVMWDFVSLRNSPPPDTYSASIMAGGYTQVEWLAVNRSGATVGEAVEYLSTGMSRRRAVLYTGGRLVDINAFATWPEGRASVINDAGVVAGHMYDRDANTAAMFVYKPMPEPAVQIIPISGVHPPTLYDINASGKIVGVSDRPFLYDTMTGTMLDLGTLVASDSGWVLSTATAINDRGQVAGWGTRDGYTRTFLYTPDAGGGGVFAEVPGLHSSGHTIPRALNAAGQIVGNASVAGGGTHAFIFTPTADGASGTIRGLGTFGGWYSDAVAINDAGQVVGWAQPATGTTGQARHAFLYTPGENGDQIQDLHGFTGRDSQAVGITDDGHVIGDSWDGGFKYTKAAGTRLLSDLLPDCEGRIVLPRAVGASGHIAAYSSVPGQSVMLTPGEQVPTSQIIVYSVTGVYGGSTRLSAFFSISGCRAPGRTLHFALDETPVGSVATDVGGTAILDAPLGPTPAGTHERHVRVTYEGDPDAPAANADATLTVERAIPVVTWDASLSLVAGEPLTSEQLSASASVPGVFTYARARRRHGVRERRLPHRQVDLHAERCRELHAGDCMA